MTQPTFPLGQIIATKGVLTTVTQADIDTALARHGAGDWGDLDEDGRKENERSLEHGALCSIYRTSNSVKFFIITEGDRSVTTVLLPEDY